jgi:hypothetical protein
MSKLEPHGGLVGERVVTAALSHVRHGERAVMTVRRVRHTASVGAVTR